jgi:hypothetical protein
MNFKINETISVKSDPRNVILIDNKINPDGVKYEVPLGYYGTLREALHGYKNYNTNTSESTSVNELLAALDKIDKTIDKVDQTLKELNIKERE